MSLIYTMPGKLGDALLEWPVAYQYCKAKDVKCTLWLDEGSLKPLVPLFEAQPCVEAVELKPGVQNYTCGGQPFDFGLATSDYIDHQVIHLGFRKFPERQITLQTLHDAPFELDSAALCQEPSIMAPDPMVGNRCVLHGTFVSHHTGSPGFWRFLNSVRGTLEDRFDEITFVGTQAERDRARELYPDWDGFDDGGSFLELANLMVGSRLVLGSGSCGVALAGVLKVPCVRVHDPIGDAPKVIWSNTGENQINETELTLRKDWPAFIDRWCPSRVVGVPEGAEA